MSAIQLDRPQWIEVQPGELNSAPEDVDETWAETVPAAETPDFSRDAQSALIAQWVELTMSHARAREIDGEIVVDVAGVDGAWASGPTEQAAKRELAEVLEGWVRLKLEDGDDDIPPMEGLHLVVER